MSQELSEAEFRDGGLISLTEIGRLKVSEEKRVDNKVAITVRETEWSH